MYFTICAPNVAATTAATNAPIAIIVDVARRLPSPLSSLAGHCHHCHRSLTIAIIIAHGLPSPSLSLARCCLLAVAIAVAHRSPSPSPSLAGCRCHHHRCNYPIYQVRLCVIRYCGASRVWSIRCVRDGHGSTGDRTAILVTILQNSPSFRQQS